MFSSNFERITIFSRKYEWYSLLGITLKLLIQWFKCIWTVFFPFCNFAVVIQLKHTACTHTQVCYHMNRTQKKKCCSLNNKSRTLNKQHWLGDIGREQPINKWQQQQWQKKRTEMNSSSNNNNFFLFRCGGDLIIY